MRSKTVTPSKIEIFIAGEFPDIFAACQEYCESGFCVTVTPTTYVFKGGYESGAVIGLINYARFPTDEHSLWLRAERLANMILERAGQQSYTIQSASRSTLYTNRPDHVEV